MISEMSKQISSSESIAGFWNTVAFLLDEGKIQAGVDFKIHSTTKLSFTDKNGTEVLNKVFSPPEKHLYIRFSRVHPLYMEKHRQQTGKNGVDLVSILHYLKNHKSYIGNASQVRFDTSNTSAFVFKYGPSELNVNLDRTVRDAYYAAKEESNPTVPPEDISQSVDFEPELPF